MVRPESPVAEAKQEMSKSKAISRPFEQTAQQRAELDALRRMLDLSEGTFSLSIAVCNSPALRDHIIEHITGEVEGIQVVRVPEDARDVFDLVRLQVPNGNPRAIFVVDLEKALGEEKRSRVLQGLNVSREQWQATFQCPVVFWLPEYVTSLLMTQARDLWSWISHNFEFISEQATAPAGMQDSYAGDIALASNLDVHEKRFRIAELEQRIADAGHRPQGQLQEYKSVWRNELAFLRHSLGDLDGAMALHKEQERICRQAGDLDGLQRTLGHQAMILQIRGDLDGAMALYREKERICRDVGNLNSLQASLGSQAVIMQTRGDLDGAMTLQKEQERICRKLGNLDGLSVCLGNQALILRGRGDLDGAMGLFKDAERICRELGDLDGLQASLGNQAVILQARGDLDGAMALLDKQERICRQLGNLNGLQASLGNQGLILQARGDLGGAMALLKEQERICRQLGYVEGLVISLANQAETLHKMGRSHETLLLSEEAWQLASKHGFAVLTGQIESILNDVRRAVKDT